MRVCIITSAPMPPEEGMGYYVHNLAQHLTRKGHVVTLITRGDWRGAAQRDQVDGIMVWRAPFVPIYPLHVHLHGLFVNRLLKRLESEFDVINLHTPLPPPVRTRLPIVTTVHTPMKADTRAIPVTDLFSLAIRLQAPVSFRIEQALLALSGLVTSVASSVAQELAEYGLDPAQVVVVGNGVDHELFVPAGNGDTRSRPYVLYAGRLAHRKGLLDLVECARLVCERRLDVRFIIAGKGPLEPKLRSAIAQAGLDGRCELVGYIGDRQELVRLYQNAALVVHPAHYEGLPTTLLEAMACGKAVVATAVSGALDAISSGENGLLVPPKQPETMVKAVLSLLENEGLRAELGRAARRTIEERYTWDIISEGFLACYRRVLAA